MVAAPKIRCAVVAISADDNGMIETSTASYEPRFRPSDLLPWADPYISGLVRKLQAEVRSERQPMSRAVDLETLRAELEMPWDDEAYESPIDDDRRLPSDSDRWVAESESVR